MRSGWVIFCRTFRVRFSKLLLYSVGVAMSVATILSVNTLTAVCSSGVEGELDRVLLNGAQVRISGLPTEAAEDAVRDAADALRKPPMPVITANGYAEKQDCAVWGVGSCGADRFSLRLRTGRFFTRLEQDAAARVCVIAEPLACALFGRADVCGAPIQVSIGDISEPFRIVGVYTSGYAAQMMHNVQPVYLPYTVLRQGDVGITETTFWLAAQDGLRDAAVRLMDRLGEHCLITDYTAQRERIRRAFDLVADVLTMISFLSLIVASFNLLVVTRIRVNGQIREIGLKRSIGASDRDLLWEYVFEASGIALIGAGIGVTINAALCMCLCLLKYEAPFSWPLAVCVTACAELLSVLFCLVPARWAAKLPPAQSLRRDV